MKKILSLVVVAIFALSCNVFASDKPPYFDPSILNHDGATTFGNNKPISSNAIFVPSESGTFDYAFDSTKYQYSDFVIVPSTATTSIFISIVGNSEHRVTLQLIKYFENSVIYSTDVIVDDSETEAYIPFYDLKANEGYYIKVISNSINGASGTVHVYGN